MKPALLLLFCLLFFAGAGCSVSLSGPGSFDVNCRAPVLATYTLSNNSSFTRDYTITAVGANSDWISLNGKEIGKEPLAVTLSGGASEELTAFIRPQGCDFAPGTYNISLKVSGGESASKTIIATVVQTRSIGLEVSPAEQETGQCERSDFTADVSNNGESGEMVRVSVEGIPASWVSINPEEFPLGQGGTETAAIGIRPACDAAAKSYSFTVRAFIKGSSFGASRQAALAVTDSQHILIEAPLLSACAEKDSSAEILIRNGGALADRLLLHAEAQGWVSVSPAEIDLNAGEEKSVRILFSKNSPGKGNYNFALTARSLVFSKETSVPLSVSVDDCHGLSIESFTADGSPVAEGEKPQFCIEEKATYIFDIANNGTEAARIDPVVSGLDAYVAVGNAAIESGETRQITVELDLANEKPGDKNFTLAINSDGLSLKRNFALRAVDCYSIAADFSAFSEPIVLDANSKSQSFTVKVKNDGTKSQIVDVRADGPAWVFFAPTELSLQPGEEKSVFFYMSPPYDTMQGLHRSTVTAEGNLATQSKLVEMFVYGGLYSVLGSANIGAGVKSSSVLEGNERIVSATVLLSNDGNAPLFVVKVSAPSGVDANVQFTPSSLMPGESISVMVSARLEKDGNVSSIKIPLLIATDKGEVSKTIEIGLNNAPPSAGMLGLFGLGSLRDAMLVVLVLLVIALLLAIFFNSMKPRESGLAALAREVERIPGQKLEEIGKATKGGKKAN